MVRIIREFGFITRDHGGGDVLVDDSGIQGEELKALFEGQKVGFAITNEAKGPKAIKVAP